MRSILGIAIVGSFPCVVILWTWAMITALRSFSIRLPFSFAVHFYTRRKRELHAALKGSPMGTYVLISGFLLFACPFWAGLTAYDFLADRYTSWHSTYSVNRLVGSVLIWAVAGIWMGVSDWKESTKNEIGPAS